MFNTAMFKFLSRYNKAKESPIFFKTYFIGKVIGSNPVRPTNFNKKNGVINEQYKKSTIQQGL
jgi:hypothetical protein